MKYAIIGTGAIGGYYGGRLAQAGCDVDFLFHTEYEHVKRNGLRVDSVEGNFVVNPISAYRSTLDMPQADVILVALKSTANSLLPNMLQPILKPTSLVILIQNGLGLEAKLSEALPQTSIAGGMAFICSSRVAPGHINHADYGALNVGFFAHDNYDVLHAVQNDFERAKVQFTIAPDLNEARWRKLVWNIPYNGLTVALNTSTDKLMRQADSRKLVADLMEEVINGAAACGARIEHAFIDKMLSMTDIMTPYSPSMKLDFDNHRPLEIEAIYSNPVAAARKAGYEMRKTEMLEQLLKFISYKDDV
ncbi:MAG: putative 2-dehydropantoate 2-reductase [Bacteroidales bacterium]|nr:putative 2-dehydropantoate 2-reductase [Bacteroidales bacterium]